MVGRSFYRQDAKGRMKITRRVMGIGFLTAICTISVLGCENDTTGNVKNPWVDPTPTNQWVDNQTVQTSTLPPAVIQFVNRAGAKIGDPHPKIVSARTETDVTGRPMYSLVISGSFTYGADHADTLPMLVSADGSAGTFISGNSVFDFIPFSH